MPGYPNYIQPYGCSPMAYQRMDYPQQTVQQPVQAPQAINAPGGFICRPVTSRAEVEVAQIPFDGSTHLFYDTSADCLYSKTFNPANGTAPIVTYVREAPPPVVQYATVDDIKALREEIERLKKPGKANKKNDAESDE